MPELVSFFVGLCAGMFFGALLGASIMNDKWKTRIIDRDYGLHCPVDGKFAFKGECDERYEQDNG